MEQLSAEFSSRLRTAINECYKLGYRPTRIEQMLTSLGAVGLARKLILASEPQDGLKKLAKLRRLDLSMEAIMQEEKFKALFTEKELEAAAWHLSEVKKL